MGFVTKRLLIMASLVYLVTLILSSMIAYVFFLNTGAPLQARFITSTSEQFETDGRSYQIDRYNDFILSAEQVENHIDLIMYNLQGEIRNRINLTESTNQTISRIEFDFISQNVLIINIFSHQIDEKQNFLLLVVDFEQFEIIFSLNDTFEGFRYYNGNPIVILTEGDNILKILYMPFKLDDTPLARKLFYFIGIDINMTSIGKISTVDRYQSSIFQEINGGGVMQARTFYLLDNKPVVIIRLSDGPFNFHLHYNISEIFQDSSEEPIRRDSLDCSCVLHYFVNDQYYMTEFGDTELNVFFGDQRLVQSVEFEDATWSWDSYEEQYLFMGQSETINEFEIYLISELLESLQSSKIQIRDIELEGLIVDIELSEEHIILLSGINEKSEISIVNLPSVFLIYLFSQPVRYFLLLSLLPVIFYLLYEYHKFKRSQNPELFPSQNPS